MCVFIAQSAAKVLQSVYHCLPSHLLVGPYRGVIEAQSHLGTAVWENHYTSAGNGVRGI